MRAAPGARVVIVGQAPGAKVHASGEPWNDDSGAHLCEWLDITRDELLDPQRFAILPMGFCWPGRRKGGDRPPRPECAPLWHDAVLQRLPQVKLTLLVGQYAIRHYLAPHKGTLTETVRAFEQFGPHRIPLPHPSWRSRLWMQKNPWFEAEVLPVLRHRVHDALG